jgi:SET domain-containing protein
VRRSPIHGAGIFAARPIKKGEHIFEYVGERISKAESDRRGLALIEKARRDGGAAVFIFTLDDECDLDGDVPDNVARLINHSCKPNCEAWNIDNHIWICAARPIAAGEELTYDYGFEFDTWEDHPCQCGSHDCVGFIVARQFHRRVRRELSKRTPRSTPARPASN